MNIFLTYFKEVTLYCRRQRTFNRIKKDKHIFTTPWSWFSIWTTLRCVRCYPVNLWKFVETCDFASTETLWEEELLITDLCIVDIIFKFKTHIVFIINMLENFFWTSRTTNNEWCCTKCKPTLWRCVYSCTATPTFHTESTLINSSYCFTSVIHKTVETTLEYFVTTEHFRWQTLCFSEEIIIINDSSPAFFSEHRLCTYIFLKFMLILLKRFVVRLSVIFLVRFIYFGNIFTR